MQWTWAQASICLGTHWSNAEVKWMSTEPSLHSNSLMTPSTVSDCSPPVASFKTCLTWSLCRVMIPSLKLHSTMKSLGMSVLNSKRPPMLPLIPNALILLCRICLFFFPTLSMLWNASLKPVTDFLVLVPIINFSVPASGLVFTILVKAFIAAGEGLCSGGLGWLSWFPLWIAVTVWDFPSWVVTWRVHGLGSPVFVVSGEFPVQGIQTRSHLWTTQRSLGAFGGHPSIF